MGGQGGGANLQQRDSAQDTVENSISPPATPTAPRKTLRHTTTPTVPTTPGISAVPASPGSAAQLKPALDLHSGAAAPRTRKPHASFDPGNTRGPKFMLP